MIIYFARALDYMVSRKTTFGIKNILASYPELIDYTSSTSKNLKINKYHFKILEQLGGKVLLDSGGYSVDNSGLRIKLSDYIDFVNRYGGKEWFEAIASLDVIKNGGEESYNNYIDMLDHVSDPKIRKKILPVYHIGEPLELFDRYLELTDYVGLGGLVSSRIETNRLIPFLSSLFKRPSFAGDTTADNNNNSNKKKKKKIHLFGMTRFAILLKFGNMIESVDSTSWMSSTKFATVFLDNAKKGYSGFRQQKIHIPNSHTFKWLCYNVLKFQELERTVNEYINKEKIPQIPINDNNNNRNKSNSKNNSHPFKR